MRVNVQKVYRAWRQGRRCTEGSVNTDGSTIYSYATAIVIPTEDDNAVRFNNRNYSKTTTSQQNSLRVLLAQDSIIIKEMIND